jgi:pimeloyl-ACP methyl ester carboxylesterase
MGLELRKMIGPALLALSLLVAGCGEGAQEASQAGAEAGQADLAQESSAPGAEAETVGVNFQGISFSYDAELAKGVSPEQIPAAAEAENAPTWAIYPAHVQFTFNDYLLETPINQPRLYVYPANQYRAINTTATEQIERLEQLLASRPETPEENLPFLPLFNANQVIHPQVTYLEFQNGSGIRFLTQYSQAVGPINNNELFYTFQGLTDDGAYYVSAIFPVSHPSLPADASTIPGGDLSAFESNFENYRVETMQQLSQAEPSSFTPDLTRLDQLVETISVTADPEAQAGSSGWLDSGVRYRNLTLGLAGKVETDAQLTFPGRGEGPWPTVILIPGLRPQAWEGNSQAANFQRLAEALSQSGLAVLHFQPQGTLEVGQVGAIQPGQDNLAQFLADVDRVMQAAKIQPEINPAYLFLYGWDEGAQVAAEVARTHPGLAGLILQAPPYGGPERLLAYQHLEVGLPFLKAETDRNRDGQLSGVELATIPLGPVQLMPLFYIWAANSTPARPLFQAGLDWSGDGLIHLEQELRPWIEAQIPKFAEELAQNSPITALETLVQSSEMPLLILQGGKDGWVPPADAEALAAQAVGNGTLKQYPHLGHALSLTGQPARDELGQMAQESLNDIANWIQEVVERSAMMAQTGVG